MRTILVLNPKGGCGKSTISTNIAGYYANQGRRIAIADLDVQKSSGDWLSRRPETAAEIFSATLNSGKLKTPRKTEIIVIDSPAHVHGKRLANFVKISQTMVMPLLPSSMDISSAERFISELFSLRKLINRKIKLAVVANRVREDTMSAAKLEYYLTRMKLPNGRRLPFLTVFRNSQNYVKAAENGLSIFEFAPSKQLMTGNNGNR